MAVGNGDFIEVVRKKAGNPLWSKGMGNQPYEGNGVAPIYPEGQLAHCVSVLAYYTKQG